MQLPLAHVDASVLEEISVQLWRQLFAAIGWPPSLKGAKRFTHEDLLEALAKDPLTDELLEAIEALHTLGTEAGREVIIAALNDRRISLASLPSGVGDRELALHLFLRTRSDARMADVFARAQAGLQEGGDRRRYNEFMGLEARSVGRLADKTEALEARVRAYCCEKDMGDHVRVRAFEDDGAYVFHVLRSHFTKKPLAVIPGRDARATIEYRPVHGDIVRYEASVGRLRIAARAASMVEFYRESLGDLLFRDSGFFSGDPAYSLKILQERGRRAFEDHGVPGVGRVWMTECLWERGDRDLLHLRSTNCFTQIEELGLPLEQGELIQAKLKLEVIGKSTRPVTVTIRVSSRIEVSQKSREHLVDELLTAVGIRNPKPLATAPDLWSLEPWRHPVHVWSGLFGSRVDALVQEGVLTPVQLGSVMNPDAPAGGTRSLRTASRRSGVLRGEPAGRDTLAIANGHRPRRPRPRPQGIPGVRPPKIRHQRPLHDVGRY